MENNQFNPENNLDINKESINPSLKTPVSLEHQAQPVESVPSQLSNNPTLSNPQVLKSDDNTNIPNQPNVIVESQDAPTSFPKQPFLFSTPGQSASGIVDTESKQKKKRFLTIIMVALVFLLILGGGGGFAYYTAMNNRPEKVLADALGNTLKDLLDRKPSSAIGSIKYEFKGAKNGSATFEYNSKTADNNTQQEASLNLKYENVDVAVKGAVIMFGSDETYVKFDELKQTVDQISKKSPDLALVVEAYKPLVDKIDSKWIKIDKQSLVELGFANSEEEVDKCSTALTNLRISKKDQKQIKKLFLENQFAFAVEKLPKDKVENEVSYHYKLDFNEQKSINFMKSMLGLESYKTLKSDCRIKDEEFDKQLEDLKNNTSKEADKIKPVVELWVGGKTRLPTKLKVTTSEETVTMEFVSTIKINDKNFKIEAPADSMNIKDLKSELESLFSNGITSSSSSPTSASDDQIKNLVASMMAFVIDEANNNNGAYPPNAKAMNEAFDMSVSAGSNNIYNNQQLKFTEETPKDGEIQYKIKVSCSNGEFLAKKQGYPFAMRAKLSDGSFYCLD